MQRKYIEKDFVRKRQRADNSLKGIKRMDEIVIFGWSGVGKKLYKDFYEKGIAVSGICDNSRIRREKIGGGIEVGTVQDTSIKFPNAIYYLASLYHQKQMKDQLLELGISKENIRTDLPESIIDEEMRDTSKKSQTRKNKITFQVSIAKHCNLNCAMCNHFAPLSEESFLDIEVFKKDIERMSELFGGEADGILLLGGEPLLNPDIDKYIKIARHYFKDAEIRIVTNGILLKRMSDAFWKACIDNKAVIAVTKYPINLDYEEIIQLCEEHNCAFDFMGISEATRTFNKECLDISGSQDYNKNFLRCRWGNSCITLDTGRLFSCRTPANIDIFNRYFDMNLEPLNDDFVNIYDSYTKEEVLQKLASPMLFCRYCNMNNWTYDNDFKISSRDISEWV